MTQTCLHVCLPVQDGLSGQGDATAEQHQPVLDIAGDRRSAVSEVEASRPHGRSFVTSAASEEPLAHARESKTG